VAKPVEAFRNALKIPELKRVIVAYQNQIVMAETLDAAIEKIFSRGAAIRPPDAEAQTAASAGPPVTRLTGAESTSALAALARQHYDRAIEAQRDGDWARYGEEIRQLGAVLAKMGAAPAAPTSPEPLKK